MQDEDGLVRRAQAGESSAFAQLYEGYFDRVYRYISLRVGDWMEAEDLAEQVFLRVLESIGSFKWRGAPFASWLFRIAHNQVVDYWRKRGRRQTVPLDPSLVYGGSDPVSHTEVKLRMEELSRAMGRLTKAQQRVISLRFGAELSLAETAQAMERSEGAIKALQHSALAALRRLLPERD